MHDINSVIIVGRLAADAMTKSLSDGTMLATFPLASNYQHRNQDQWEKAVNYFDCEQFGVSEALLAHLVKGKQVCLAGFLRQERWTAQDGTARSKVKILVLRVQLLGSNDQSHIDTESVDTTLVPSFSASPIPF